MKNVYGYIYLTTNLVNGKRYIGQHLGQRFERSYFGSGTLLIQAIKKYKTKNFKVELLIWVESNKERVIVKNREISKEMADLDQWEIHYIKDKKSHISYLDENENEMGYNLSWGGMAMEIGQKNQKRNNLNLLKNILKLMILGIKG